MRIYSATDVGQKRKMNQDYVFASADPVGNLPNLFVVADGMGGHNAGDYRILSCGYIYGGGNPSGCGF